MYAFFKLTICLLCRAGLGMDNGLSYACVSREEIWRHPPASVAIDASVVHVQLSVHVATEASTFRQLVQSSCLYPFLKLERATPTLVLDSGLVQSHHRRART